VRAISTRLVAERPTQGALSRRAKASFPLGHRREEEKEKWGEGRRKETSIRWKAEQKLE
jgi:hypothetical protein